MRLSESLSLLLVDIRSSSDLTSPLLSLGLPLVPLTKLAVRVPIISPPHRARPHCSFDPKHGPEAGEPILVRSTTCLANISVHPAHSLRDRHTLSAPRILARHVVAVEAVSSLTRQTVSLVRRPLELALTTLMPPDPGDLTLPVLAGLTTGPRHWWRLVEALTLLPPRAL